MDLAAQTWQQVLLSDHNNADALEGLARAAKQAGNSALATVYEDRLKAIHPPGTSLGAVLPETNQQGQNSRLTQAGKLAESGQYTQAMAIYRQVFGAQPPPGVWALAYYETEAATNGGRAHAIVGLRALSVKYPTDARYQIALGRILTYDPKTRAEGRKLLEQHRNDPQAAEALKQSQVWEATKTQPRQPSAAKRPLALTGETARSREQNEQMEAAYRALNARRIEEAQERFKEILANDPENSRALAGMGYVRMQQSNFAGAISFLEQAEQDGARDPVIEKTLSDARFYFAIGEGTVALHSNNLTTAERQYLAALQMRPASTEALDGLGETLMKAQQPQVAVQVYERYVKVKPTALAGWRGLFLSKYGAGNAAGALLTEQAIPAAVHGELMRDPEFLRALAAAYSATGHDADAQMVLRDALDLPFPPGGLGIKAEAQLQYAGLLEQAHRLDQAAGLYRQVLAVEPANTAAWQGLVRTQHALQQDQPALQSVEVMPSSTYDSAMRDPGFQSMVAAIYLTQNKLDTAQGIIEKAIAEQARAGEKPSPALQTQLAWIYLAQGDTQRAYPIYRKVLAESPNRTDAWKGLLSTLHRSGRDQEALAEMQQMPAPVRRALENDFYYLQTIANIYSKLGQPDQAMVWLKKVEQRYATRYTVAPGEIEIQNAFLLFSSPDEPGLFRQLMLLGGRQDLSDEQRRSVQTIWTLWASRRANQAAAAGDSKRALAILNAAARAFPENPAVLKLLATGYVRAGLPKQAVLIFKAQSMTSASAADYKTALAAALAANDKKDAEIWLEMGLRRYPRDAQLLMLGAQLEQARGDSRRAVEYYKASLAGTPASDSRSDAGAELVNELSSPLPVSLPSRAQHDDLASLLQPGIAESNTLVDTSPSTRPDRPYLPAYSGGYETTPFLDPSAGASEIEDQPDAGASHVGAVPSYMTNPGQPSSSKQPEKPAGTSGPKLKDYVPPQVEPPAGGYSIPKEPPPGGMSGTNRTGYSLNAQAYERQQIQRLTWLAEAQKPYLGPPARQNDPGPRGSTSPQMTPATQEVYGPYVPYATSARTSPDPPPEIKP